MSGRPPRGQTNASSEITIVLVDDIPETRENIKKLLAFETDFKVIGTAGTGREGVDIAKDLKPDVMIMDINMPDMDGLQATNLINKAVPTTAVIIMSVQDDADYMRRAMLAGARDFLTKPVDMDSLYNTIRTVYQNHEAIRRQYEAIEQGAIAKALQVEQVGDEDRAGNIIVVYSPKGGVGTTTIATSLASGLMKEDVKVLVVDADLQFADVWTFLNLSPQTTVVDLIPDVDDLDVDLFENIVTTHDSGIKVLAGPTRPEFADEVKSRPDALGMILSKIANNYDFIIVDTSCQIDETLMGIFDTATKVVLVATPTLVALKELRFVLDLFDQLGYEPDRTLVAMNKAWDDKRGKGATISNEKAEGFLKRQIIGTIPMVDERIILSAITRGVPIVGADRDQNKPPIKQLLELSETLYTMLMGEEEEPEEEVAEKSGASRFKLFGRS